VIHHIAANAPALNAAALAWRPFLDPLPMHGLWWTLIFPLALGVAVAYKAVSVPNMDRYWPQVARMTAQIILGMFALAAALYIFVELIVPLYG